MRLFIGNKPAALAFEQLQLQRTLQIVNEARDGRLRDIQQLGSWRNATRQHDGAERFYLTRLQHSTLKGTVFWIIFGYGTSPQCDWIFGSIPAAVTDPSWASGSGAMSAGPGVTRTIALIAAVLAAAGIAGPVRSQTVLQLNGNGSDSVSYSIFNDGSGIVEAGISGGAASNGGTLAAPAGIFPTGSTISLSVGDNDILPVGFISGTTLVQPLGGFGGLFIDVGSTDLLSANVAGGDIYGTNGSSTATIVLDLSALSTASTSGLSVPAGAAYLELPGTTSVPLALTSQCLSPPVTSPCLGPSQLNLTALNIDWSSGIVTTTAPVIPSSGPPQVYLNSTVLGQSGLSWSSSANWLASGSATTPQAGDDVFLTNTTGTSASGPTVVTYDATTNPTLNSLTIDSNAGGQLVELLQSANALTSGSETIGTTGTAEHLQSGGVNSISETLTINGFGTYDFQGGTLSAQNIVVNSGGQFFFDGGTTSAPTVIGTFTLNSGGTVASGSASSPGSGTGTEIISAPALDAANFNQQGGTNNAGTFVLGQTGGTAQYLLAGGNLNAATETIGPGAPAAFTQTGGTNTVSGTLSLTQCPSCSMPNSYTLGGGTTALTGGILTVNTLQVNTGTAFILQGGAVLSSGAGGETVTGSFTQSGSSTNGNQASLTIESGGTYDLQGGLLTNNVTVNAGGQFLFDGGSWNGGTFTLKPSG